MLRYNCGFDVIGNIPSESTFSRFMNKLSASDELYSLFKELVLSAKQKGLIDGNNVSLDSSKISSYEAAAPKSKINDDGTNPNWGMKRDTNGNNIRWFAWKVHAVCDSKFFFISHSIKDKDIVSEFMDDILIGGLGFHYTDIFFTSVDGTKM